MAEHRDWPFTAANDNDAPDEIARTFARLFTGDDGLRVLAHLRALTIERRTSPDLADAPLRYLEGQRGLVGTIETLIARGRG